MEEDEKIVVKRPTLRLSLSAGNDTVTHVEDVLWKPELHPRWPKGTIIAGKNVGGDFKETFDTDSIKELLGPEPETNGPSDTRIEMGFYVKGAKDIEDLQLFRAKGATGDKVIARMLLRTVIPKAPVIETPKPSKSDKTKLSDLPVGTKFQDANHLEWEVTGRAGESYVEVKPVGVNPFDVAPTARMIGMADVTLDTPLAKEEASKEWPQIAPEDDSAPEYHETWAAFVTDFADFTLDKLNTLLVHVDNAQNEAAIAAYAGYKNSPKEGYYPQHLAAKKGVAHTIAPTTSDDVTVFGRPAISNTPDTAPHDPSIKQHENGSLTDAQWENFGANDQKRYNDLTEKFGAWTDGSGKHQISKVRNAAEGTANQDISNALSKQAGTGKFATDLGFIFDYFFPHNTGNNNMNIYGSKDPEKISQRYMNANNLLHNMRDVASWDLYNRIRDPSIILFHFNNTDPDLTQKWAEEAQYAESAPGITHGPLAGGYPYYGGLSWTTNMGMEGFGSGGSMIVARMPIRQIAVLNHLTALHSPGEAEYVVQQEMFFDLDNTIITKAGGYWPGGDETWKKMNALSGTGKPKPGSYWDSIKAWSQGFLEPKKPVGSYKAGSFFSDADGTVWHIDKVDINGVDATSYADKLGAKVTPEKKTFKAEDEFSQAKPRVRASDLGIGEVVEDTEGNQWQHIGIEHKGVLFLAPYNVTGGDQKMWKIPNDDTKVPVVNLAVEVPDWTDEYLKAKTHSTFPDQLEDAIVLTPWGQRFQVLKVAKHGEETRAIQVDDDNVPLPDTERTFDGSYPVAVLKEGHPPPPPPKIGETVNLQRLGLGDVFTDEHGDELKIANITNDGKIFATYTGTSHTHLRGQFGEVTPVQKVKYTRREPLDVVDAQTVGPYAGTTWLEDLKVGDTFVYNRRYWRVDSFEGDMVNISSPNPTTDQAPTTQLEKANKVVPSGIPAKPQMFVGVGKTQAQVKDLNVGDQIESLPGETYINGKITRSIKDGYGSARVDGNVALYDGEQYVNVLTAPERPTVGQSVPAKQLWIGDVVQTGDGVKLKIAQAPNVRENPFVNYETGEPEPFYDAGAMYTFLGTDTDLKTPDSFRPASLPQGKSYDTIIGDTRGGYIIQTKNGTQWRVEEPDSGTTATLVPVDKNGDDIEGSKSVTVSLSGADPISVIDTGRRFASDLKVGDVVKNEQDYGNATYVVIGHKTDGTAITNAYKDVHGKNNVNPKPALREFPPDTELIHYGVAEHHPEVSPNPSESAGYAKKSALIDSVDVWSPGAMVVSANYFYMVVSHDGNKTVLADMGGQQHVVDSKKFLVKSANNGPKPVKGLKLYITTDTLKSDPVKGQYIYAKGKRWVVSSVQKRTTKGIEIDENGNHVGEVKTIMEKKAAMSWTGSWGISNAPIVLHASKDGSEPEKKFTEAYDAKTLVANQLASATRGDYVRDNSTGAKFFVVQGATGSYNTKYAMDLAMLDSYGNPTGEIVTRELGTSGDKYSINEEPYDIVTGPDGSARINYFPAGSLVEYKGAIGRIYEQGGNWTEVAWLSKPDDFAINLAYSRVRNLRVTAYTGKEPTPQPGQMVALPELKVGDKVKVISNNYGGTPILAQVEKSDHPYFSFKSLDPAHTDFALNNGSNAVKQGAEFVSRGDNTPVEAAPLPEVAPSVVPKPVRVTPEPTPIPTPPPPPPAAVVEPPTPMVATQVSRNELQVGDIYGQKVVNGEYWKWQFVSQNADGSRTIKAVDKTPGSAQEDTLTVTPHLIQKFGHKMVDLLIPAEAPPVAVDPPTPEEVTWTPNELDTSLYDETGRTMSENSTGDKILIANSTLSTQGIPGDAGNLFVVTERYANAVSKVTSQKTGEEYYVSNAAQTYPFIGYPTPTKPQAESFVKAVRTTVESGTPQKEAVARVATQFDKPLDWAHDAFKEAGEPLPGEQVPVNELGTGDTFETNTGWVWKITGTSHEGKFFLVEKATNVDGQPTKLEVPAKSTTLVKKIATDQSTINVKPVDAPSATIDVEKLATGDTFTIRDDDGEIRPYQVMSVDGNNIHLQVLGSTKGKSFAKNFKTTLTNIKNQIDGGTWTPM